MQGTLADRDGILVHLVAKALELQVDTLEVEYKDGREEVSAVRDCVGVGIASLDSSSSEVRAFRERIGKIGKRGLSLTVGGQTYRLKVTVYDTFGEEAYRIEIGSPNKAAPPGAAKRGSG